MNDTFLNRVFASFEVNKDKVAMRIVGTDSHTYTFGETQQMVLAIAEKIKKQGIEQGDRVIIIGENHPFWAVAYLAVLYCGGVCVPLDPHGETATIKNFLINSEAKLAFIDAGQTDRFAAINKESDLPVPTVVWNPPSQLETSDSVSFFDDWLKNGSSELSKPVVPVFDKDVMALLIYTSGTTGTPKGVPLTHGNILAELDGIDEVLSIKNTDKILSLLPLFHAYLQIVNMWVATTKGCEVGYLKELSPTELSDALKTFKPTILTTVPRLWYVFHKKIFDTVAAKSKMVQRLFRAMLAINGFSRNVLKIDLGHKLFGTVHESFGGDLRVAVTAGSRFDENVADDFFRLGFTIIQGYGLTETSGAATATYIHDNRVGSVGRPMKGVEVKLDNPNDEGIGEVLIKGPVVFSGYYKNPEANEEAFTDGWFRSGDLGTFDKDGHLYIVGRAKDVIVLPSGKNVHPEDLEVHYLQTPYIEEMAVIGIDDEKAGRAGAEKLAAVIVPDFEYLKQANISNSREIIRYTLDGLGRELPEYQRVRDYIIRAEPLPRTATRKIKRFELKKQVESGALAGDEPRAKPLELAESDKALIATPVAERAISVIRKATDYDGVITPDMNLEIDLGLDSLSRAETFAALEHSFSTPLDGEEAAKALTIRNVIDLFTEKTAGQELSSENTAISWPDMLDKTKGDFPEVRTVLKNRTAFAVFAWSVYKLFYLFSKVVMRLEVENIEELEKMDAPFIICPNHQSYIDPFVLCSTYSFEKFRHVFHVGASMYFETPFMRLLARILNVVPIDPDKQLVRAMQVGAVGLKAGKILNIYPEGERSYDGKLHNFKKGAAILSSELDLPILPVALDGMHIVWPRGGKRIRLGKVKIRFGKPIIPSAELKGKDIEGDEKYQYITAILRDQIEEMIKDMRRS